MNNQPQEQKQEEKKPIIQKGMWVLEPVTNSLQPKKWYKADFENGVLTRRWPIEEYAGEIAPDGTVIVDPNPKKVEEVVDEDQAPEDNNQDNTNETQVDGSEEISQDPENKEEFANENDQEQKTQVINAPFSAVHNNQGKHNQGNKQKKPKNNK